MIRSTLKSCNLRSKKFLSENFEVSKSFPSREKKMQICQNAPTPLSLACRAVHPTYHELNIFSTDKYFLKLRRKFIPTFESNIFQLILFSILVTLTTFPPSRISTAHLFSMIITKKEITHSVKITPKLIQLKGQSGFTRNFGQ